MYNVVGYVRANNECPYEGYLENLKRTGAKKEIARIVAVVRQLRERGVYELAQMTVAKKMNDIWELRPHPHRIFFFFDSARQRYVLLHGYRKKSQRTPHQEIERAERLMAEYYRSDR